MSKILAVITLSALGTAAAVASENGHWWNGPSNKNDGPSFHSDRFNAPEIDPSSAISALTLLGGGLTVLRSRMSSKN